MTIRETDLLISACFGVDRKLVGQQSRPASLLFLSELKIARRGLSDTHQERGRMMHAGRLKLHYYIGTVLAFGGQAISDWHIHSTYYEEK